MSLTVNAIGFELDFESTTSGTVAIVASTDTASVVVGRLAYPFTGTHQETTVNLTSGQGVYQMPNVAQNGIYSLRIRPYSGANATGTAGTYQYFTVYVPVLSNSIIGQKTTSTYQYNGAEDAVTKAALAKLLSESVGYQASQSDDDDLKEVDTGITIGQAGTVSKSLLTISKNNEDPQTISMAIKNTGMNISGSLPAYYSFGTTMFFKATTSESKQSGGMGFFVNQTGNTGYFLNIRTTETASTRGDTEVKLIKVNKGNNINVPDSQVLNTNSQIKGIYGPESYKVDINVKVEATKISFIIFVNGFKITATDTQKSPSSIKNDILSRTQLIGLYSSLGTTNFDYVYAMPISKDKYDNSELMNIYEDDFAAATSSIAYGDLFITGLANTNTSTQNPFIQEFGPVAREIRNINFRYSTTPAFPKYPTTAANKFVKILGTNLSSFNAEMYILNNAGTYIPLNGDTKTTISILGNSIDQSSPLEYMDEEINQYISQEPITFNSKWIQKYDDAKNLSTWIKGQLKNQQIKVVLKAFGNPLISVGDIISISYPFNDLSGTEKFLVTNVTQSWNEGLETTIAARSIYS